MNEPRRDYVILWRDPSVSGSARTSVICASADAPPLRHDLSEVLEHEATMVGTEEELLAVLAQCDSRRFAARADVVHAALGWEV